MSLNTLSNIVATIIEKTHINEVISALRGQFVGRNSSGAPTAGQDLGTDAIPWGTANVTDIKYRGILVAPDVFASSRNRIVSGKTRADSIQPDFLRASGSSNALTIVASELEPLELIINDTVVTITSDIVVTGLTVAPSSNNTANLVSSLYADQNASKYVGEAIGFILINSAGSEIMDRVGLSITLKSPDGELFIGNMPKTQSGTTSGAFGDAKRGYFFDSNGDPIPRGTLANADTLTLMMTGWVFIQDNGVTVDVSYITPIISGSEPTLGLDGNALIDGQYWFDLDAQEWKRYSSTGSAFETVNRILLGTCVLDSSNCIGTRSNDFSKAFDSYNTVELVRDFSGSFGSIVFEDLIKTSTVGASVSVYGNRIDFPDNYIYFDPTTNMESGVSYSSGNRYYCYLTESGVPKISDIAPHRRPSLRGFYHPYHSWRAVGDFLYNASSVAVGVTSYGDRLQQPLLYGTTTNADPVDIAYSDKNGIYRIPIDAWDMDTDNGAGINIDGLQYYLSKTDFRIIDLVAYVRFDAANSFMWPLHFLDYVTGKPGGGYGNFDSQNDAIQSDSIKFWRTSGGIFDDPGAASTSIVRGYAFLKLEI